MKIVKRWHLALWLVALLCLPWSMAEAGRPVNLSDYLNLRNISEENWVYPGDRWIYQPLPGSTNADGSIPPDIQLTLVTDPVTGKVDFDYSTGKYDPDTTDPELKFVVSEEKGIFFSYDVSPGSITINGVPIFDVYGDIRVLSLPWGPLNDRQPTDRLITLSSDYAMQLDLPRDPIAGHPSLIIKFLDASGESGDRKNPHPLSCELDVSIVNDLYDTPGIMAFKMNEKQVVKEGEPEVEVVIEYKFISFLD